MVPYSPQTKPTQLIDSKVFPHIFQFIPPPLHTRVKSSWRKNKRLVNRQVECMLLVSMIYHLCLPGFSTYWLKHS